MAIAGIAAGAYYFYRNGEQSPVAAVAMTPSKPVLTNPNDWIDFKVSPSLPQNDVDGPVGENHARES